MNLTPEQLNTLEVFTSKGGAFDVVYQIAMEHIEKKRDLFVKSTSLLKNVSSQEIGDKVKTYLQALELVESIFRELGQYRKTEVKDLKHNPAR